MANIKLFTDSTCDLTDEILEKYDISFVPLYVHFNEDAFKDRIDITTEELYQKVDEYGVLPMTAAPSPGDFYNAFKPFVDEGREILYIGISTLISSTVQNATIAKGDFEDAKIEIVDTFNLSTGEGLLLFKAVDLINQGMALEEIGETLRAMTPKLRTSFVVDTLDYLYKGGRCSAVQHFFSSLLKIRPIIQIVEGKMTVGEKVRGKMEKALDLMIEDVLSKKGKIDSNRIFLPHSMAQDSVKYVKSALEKELDNPEFIVTGTGCVVSSHCGKGTLGVIYMEA
ncbi:MAG: fatty acid-binding protein DegV [Clostridiales bacterium GWB2_37_7]|nr:MAG: fatty acid-binding protein DegV [Clostridiales bacterium GWB2_37_7]